MDFDFFTDHLSQPLAKFSMGHEAIGRLLSFDIGRDLHTLDKLLNIITQIEKGDRGFVGWAGKEFDLQLSLSEVTIQNHESDLISESDLDDDFHFYEDESSAECGLADFKNALLAWREFVS